MRFDEDLIAKQRARDAWRAMWAVGLRYHQVQHWRARRGELELMAALGETAWIRKRDDETWGIRAQDLLNLVLALESAEAQRRRKRERDPSVRGPSTNPGPEQA